MSSDARRSALMVGTVMHRRLHPFPHGFRYGLAMYRLDLDELPAIDGQLRLFGVDRARPVSYRRADHVPDVRALLAANGVYEPVARIELVTNCRVFGYVFNPVSFFFCYGTQDHLVAIVCEVHNTFGESHTYVLPAETSRGQWDEKKVFHVSPFFTVDGTYRFRFSVGDEHVDAGIDLYRGGTPQFVSHLRLRRRPLSDRAIAWSLLRYPLVTLKITTAIHWQALRLWWKGALYHPKPAYDPESAHRTTEP